MASDQVRDGEARVGRVDLGLGVVRRQQFESLGPVRMGEHGSPLGVMHEGQAVFDLVVARQRLLESIDGPVLLAGQYARQQAEGQQMRDGR